MKAQDQQSRALWIDPNDKTRAQYLPHIGEAVLFKHSGRVYTGKHTGGSFKADYPLGKSFTTWDCVWMYPAELDTATRVQAMGRVPPGWTDDQMIRFAWMCINPGLRGDSISNRLELFREHEALRGIAAPRPPAAQERRPFTDEQIDAALVAWFGNDQCLEAGYQYRMRRAINAAHGITHPTGD